MIEAPAGRRAERLPLALIVVAGLLLRVYPWLLPHAFLGVLEQDDGIYYGAARLLLDGQLPYRDFTIVHPPGAAFLLVPSAMIGALLSDPIGMAAARVFVAGVAVANILLVYRLALRLPAAPGRAPLVALAAAAVYAVLPNAVIAEHTALLEPLVNLPCLLAVLLLTRAGPLSRRRIVAAGLLLALAVGTKLFAAAYVLALAGWLLAAGRRQVLPWLAAGIAAGLAIVVTPFAVAAPGAFWQDVVVTQLTRPLDSGYSRGERLLDLLGLGTAPLALAIGLAALLLAEVVSQARREPLSPYWIGVGVVVVGGLAFVMAASYFPHYGGFLAPPLAVLVTRCLARERLSRLRYGGLALLMVVFLAESVGGDAGARGQSDLQAIGRQVPAGSCVFSESASLAVAADLLRPSSPSCPAWLDGRGLLYSRSGDWPRGRDFYFEGFTTNVRWQGELMDQLGHADYLLLRTPPPSIREWSVGTQRYALEHFQRFAGQPGVELWVRR